MNYEFPVSGMLAVVGRRGSGKTSLLISYLGTKLSGKYHEIYIISPTAHLQECWKSLDIPPQFFQKSFDSDWFQQLCEKNGKQQKLILVILDDLAFARSSSGSKNSVKNDEKLNMAACLARHYKIGIIILSQRFTTISKTVRSQCDGIVVFKCGFEEKLILYELCDHLFQDNKEKYLRLCAFATEEKYSYLTIDISESRVYKNDHLLKLKK